MDDLGTRLDRLSPEARSYICTELCKHLIAARQFDRLDLILTNLEFLAARCALHGLEDAIRDFEAARIAQGDRWEEDSGQAQFSRFLSRRSHLLRFEPSLIWQEAFNSVEPQVQRSAACLWQLGKFPVDPWLRKLSGVVEDHHSGQVISMAFWGEERYLAVSTTALEVWVWDCMSGRVRRRCETPPSPAKTLAASPSGEYLAAGYGSAFPTPMLAGVRVWSRDGGVALTQVLNEWVYTVRWRNDTEIIAGAGLPSGSEAVGTLWQIDMAAATCAELGNWLADRPLLLTWDPVAGDSEQVMALSHDGFVLHLRPEYVPISREEAQELSLKLMSDGDYGAHDARMEQRRPVVCRICAPTADQFGYLTVADTIGASNRICLLGEPPVPPELLMFHHPNPDGIYVLDLDEGGLGGFAFPKEAREAGFRALCIAASPVGDLLAIGTAHGAAYLFPLGDVGGVGPERVHQGSASVTAVCFSKTGTRLAVGDAASQIAVYDLPKSVPVFHTERQMPAVTGQIEANGELVLFVDRLEVSLGRAALVKETVTWNDGRRAVDLARWGDLAVVLCLRSKEDGTNEEQVLQIIDLRAPRVLVEAPVPSILAGSARGKLDSRTKHPFRRVELFVDEGVCHVYLGSLDGVVEFSLLLHSRPRIFLLPEVVTKRDRQMTVMRMGVEEPDLACGVFTILTRDGCLLCGYSDNRAHPNVSGELHHWDLHTLAHSEVMRFASAITAIGATSTGIVVLGTEHGEVASLRRDGEWHRLAELQHPVAVSCVACDECRQLACSVSLDGLIQIWDLLDGTRRLSTSVDIEPVHVDFASEGTRLSVVDRTGQIHVWELENYSELGGGYALKVGGVGITSDDGTAVIEVCLRAAEKVGRAVEAVARGDLKAGITLLEDLPEVSNRSEIQSYWRTVIESMRQSQC